MQSDIGYCQILVIGYCQILVIGYCYCHGYGLIMSNIGVANWLLEFKLKIKLLLEDLSKKC